MNSDSETRLARRSFPESEGQGWCSDESGLDDPRPLEPHMRVVDRDQGWGFYHRAELLNGRLAMLGFVIGLATELLSGQGILGQLGLRF
ncbi:MAG: chlorophyll a/b-binding protein [Cyanobium sp. ELA507]